MHKFVLIFILFFSVTAKTQVGYFMLGYGGNVTNVDGINEVVNNFNETRPWLDKEMKPFSYLDGVVITFGGVIDHVWAETEYGFRSQKNSASGTDLYGYFNTQ